jgi:hypothetical protein
VNSETTPGRRIQKPEHSFGNMQPGDYGIGPDGEWWLCSPYGNRGRISDRLHVVTEHEDGTITVSPSLAYVEEHGPYCWHLDIEEGYPLTWHGWLERGIWREA